MATISLTLPQSGTVITAGLHSSNYGTLQSTINGGLDNNNFATGKIFDTTKLMQNGATNGQALVWNNGAQQWQPTSVGLTTYRKTTSKTVNTTTSATDLLNGEVTIGAGVMGTTGLLRLTAWGDWLQNSGATAVAPRFQVLLGGTTLLDTGTGAGTASAASTRFGWRVGVEVFNLGSASVQSATLVAALAAGGISANGSAAFTTGEGSYALSVPAGGTSGAGSAIGYNAGAVDTSTSKALVLNVINGSANAAYETKLFGALVEVI